MNGSYFGVERESLTLEQQGVRLTALVTMIIVAASIVIHIFYNDKEISEVIGRYSGDNG